MRACSIVVVIAACRFAPAPLHAADAGAGRIVDDTAADFAAGSATDLDVDPLGLLVPATYATGGLHARGFATALVTTTTTWDQLVASLPAPTGEAYGAVPAVDWGGDRPYGLGLGPTRTDNFTVVYDGELHLDAGATTLELSSDDDALVELDLGAIRPLLRSSVVAASAPTTVTPAAAGWYPIHVAVSDNGGSANIMLSLGRGTTPAPVTGDVLRAPLAGAQGLIVSGATTRLLAPTVAATSVETALAQDWGTDMPPGYDLGVAGNDFSLRFAGQLRIDQAGAYTFGLDVGADTNDYARLVVDGTAVASTWPGQLVTPAPVPLAAGWHDLIVDYADATGDAQLHATMAAAGSAPVALAGALLRPVRATGLLAGAAPPGAQGWNTPGGTSISLALAAPDGAVVDLADAYVTVTPRAHVTAALTAPAGTSVPLALPATPAYEGTSDAFTGITGLAGTAVAGTWQLAFTDSANDGGGSVGSSTLVATYHGGPGGPYATQMTYVSAPHPTPGATSIDAVHVMDDLHGATLAVDVRTGDASTIGAAPWVSVQEGVPPAVAAGALVEYRLALTGDGWQAPAIDRVEIDYTEAP